MNTRLILGLGAQLLATACLAQPVSLPDGVGYEVVRPGSGETPRPTSTVTISFTASTARLGTIDDTSRHGGPVRVELSRSIKCWSIAIPRMQVGGTARLTCPPATAYGGIGTSRIPPNETLHFLVRLDSIARL